MNLTTTQKFAKSSGKLFENLRTRPNAVYTWMIIMALAAFEIFNFSATEVALRDMLGDQGTGFLSWSVILSLAFCAMDFAGVARLLTLNSKEGREQGGWYLFGAWALAGAMNAGFTWWAVSLAVYNHPVENILILDPMTYVTVIPVVVAVIVWAIRILIIGTLVTSLNQVWGAKPERKMAGKQSVMGFRANPHNAPAGFKPIPDGARAQNRHPY